MASWLPCLRASPSPHPEERGGGELWACRNSPPHSSLKLMLAGALHPSGAGLQVSPSAKKSRTKESPPW